MSKSGCSDSAGFRKKADELQKKLQKGPFLAGQVPGVEDVKEFNTLMGGEHQDLARWCKHMASFTSAERKQWPEKPVAGSTTIVSGKAAKPKPKKAIKKTDAAADMAGIEEQLKNPDCLKPMLPSTFPEDEEAIAKYWEEIDAFRTSLKKSEGRKRFTFYDGPPFATGLPHYGHVLAGTIKDVVCRYAHQTGHYVERRFGWDCHGLPIEFEIEQQHGIKTSHDVARVGIPQYNEWCRGIVMKYADAWEIIITRLGRWIDFKNDYKTMNLEYMETVWWVFRQLWDKGLVYRGYKVVPYSIGCTTVLSNFEAKQNYKEVHDPSVVVKMPWVEDPSISFLAWTTTPWTLPSNLMLCVNPKMEYVLIKDKETGEKYILAECRMSQIYKKIDPENKPYEVLETYLGKDLVGREYVPLFDFFAHKKADGAFRVVMDDYVTKDSGTGVVHQAPAFGEDDYRVCIAAGVVKKDGKVPCPVDENGLFTDEVPNWKGVMVKDADKDILKNLKERKRLYSQGSEKHEYPFCWRSDKPLIYKAVESWFINVPSIKEKILESTRQTTWVPETVTNRFVNWLEDARDWAVSRNRYWGTPLPIWHSEDWKEVVCIGSVAELEKLTGEKITDIHRHHIDHLTIPDPRGDSYPRMKRIPEVFDCWFESGSMPYAQQHYPFENKEKFHDGFPADFIAEGLDQTRGWFYTLLVLSTALFEKPAFKNLVVNGLVLAEDGKKMSKRLQNYPQVMEVVNRHGADALRMYLITSPVVRACELRFKEDGVKGIARDVLIPLKNALVFFTINHNRLVLSGKKLDVTRTSKNVMDHWILAAATSLIKHVHKEMSLYHLYTVIPGVVQWCGNLTNWYVRMNRGRMKGSKGEEECQDSLATLFRVLHITAVVMAPFTPFIAERIYQQLRKLIPVDQQEDSVHYCMIPEVDESLFDEDVLRQVATLQTTVEMVRRTRDRAGLGSLKKPVKEVRVMHSDPQVIADVMALSHYIADEVSAFKVEASQCTTDELTIGIEADNRAMGQRFNKEAAAIRQAINKNVDTIAKTFQEKGEVEVLGHVLTAEELKIVWNCKETPGYASSTDGQMIVMVNTQQDAMVMEEGAVREFVSRVQQLRKHAGLQMTDKVAVFYCCDQKHLKAGLKRKADDVQGNLNSKISEFESRDDLKGEKVIVEEETEFFGEDFLLVLVAA